MPWRLDFSRVVRLARHQEPAPLATGAPGVTSSGGPLHVMPSSDAGGPDIGMATDVGRVRETNEDSLFVAAIAAEGRFGPRLLVAVADGMGGHNAGEIASDLAVHSLAEALRAPHLDDEGEPDPEAALRHAVEWANQAVWRAASQDEARTGMGTTLVCALLDPSGTGVVANVGDSRAYRVTRDGAARVTSDHSWVAEQVREGRMSESEAEMSPYRHVLSRSLGVAPYVDVDLYPIALDEGAALVLCSDGVTTYLEEADFVRAISEAPAAQEAAERLVRLAVGRGGADNATVVVARRPR